MPKNTSHIISRTNIPDACCLSAIKLIENINKKEQKAEDDNGLLYERKNIHNRALLFSGRRILRFLVSGIFVN